MARGRCVYTHSKLLVEARLRQRTGVPDARVRNVVEIGPPQCDENDERKPTEDLSGYGYPDLPDLAEHLHECFT